jgi:hypothetical protein
LGGDAIARTFALLQRPACVAGALGMAPDLLIGVEIRGVAGRAPGDARLVNRMSGELGGGSENVATSSGASSHYLVTPISTRRFLARPATVLLLAIGLLSPWPAADKLLLTPPSRSA